MRQEEWQNRALSIGLDNKQSTVNSQLTTNSQQSTANCQLTNVPRESRQLHKDC
jgi:hypothetical protein